MIAFKNLVNITPLEEELELLDEIKDASKQKECFKFGLWGQSKKTYYAQELLKMFYSPILIPRKNFQIQYPLEISKLSL